jgi:hypothetical protein
MKNTNLYRWKFFFILNVALLMTIQAWSQVPQKINYQAVIRNSSNALVINTPVKMRISILKGGPSGSVVYREIHNPTTNTSGAVNLVIGQGSQPSGSIADIKWEIDSYYLKTETDPANGDNYTIVGTTQMFSVPYALFAGKTTEKEKVIFYGTNATDSVEIPANADIFSTYDGGWNRWIQLPIRNPSNNFLKERRNTTLLLTSYSSYDFRILPKAKDLTSELILNYGDYALFIYDNERWRLVSSSKNVIPQGGQEGQTLTMCAGYPNWGPCVPRLVTSLSEVKSTTAKSGGTITYSAGLPVLSRGVVWSTNPMPTIALTTKTTDGTGTGAFTSNVTGLTPNTTYYIRAYATTANGTGYGQEAVFTTPQ